MLSNNPKLIAECKKIVEQRLYDVNSFPDFILQTYSDGIKFVQVYDSKENNSIARFYNIEEVVDAVERGDIEFVNKNEHFGNSGGSNWCLQFTDGIKLQSVNFHDILKAVEPGQDPEKIVCEAKGGFRNTALALATLAGLGANFNAYGSEQCIPAQYIEEPTPEAKYNNSKSVTKAKSDWKRHRIDYMDDNDDILYSLGKGNLSSRAHNPGNLVVNGEDSIKKIGAIGYYQPGETGNKFAVFPNDEAGHTALSNWWFTGDNANMTVNQLLPKFAPEYENDLSSYTRTMKRFCVPMDKPINQFSTSEKTNLLNAVKTHEGFHRNKATEYDIYRTKK